MSADHRLAKEALAEAKPSSSGWLKRFEAKLQPEPNTGCWLWLAAHDKDGYGKFTIAHQTWARAHRVAWELFVGPLPVDMHVLHRCDEPSCVNPDHLFLGDNAHNVEDRHAKGRDARGDAVARRGEDSGTAKLTEAAIIEIRRLLPRRGIGRPRGSSLSRTTRREVATRFGVSESLVKQIVCRKAWCHV